MTSLVFLHQDSPTQRKRLYATVAAEVAACVVPAGAILFTGRWELAAEALYAVLAVFFLLHAFRRQPERFAALVIATAPFVITLRAQVFYSGLSVCLVASVGLWSCFAPDDVWYFFHSPLRSFLLVICTVYWGISFALTGAYSSNLHAVELAFSVACIFLLGRRRSELKAALIGFAIATGTVAVGAWPFGERLGMLEIDGIRFGNPIVLGLALALVLLLTIADRGRWLDLQNRPVVRLIVIGATSMGLLATTSRGSWLVALSGLLAIVLLSRQDRRVVLSSVALGLPLAILLVMSTSRGDSVLAFYDRAVAADRTLAQRTTGRADMWAAAPAVIANSPAFGFGPGSGVTVMREFTGRDKMWHALFLQVIVETGLAGTFYLLLVSGILLRRGFRHCRTCDEILPLLGIVGYLLAGLSVNAMDGISGIFLGLALMAGEVQAFGILKGEIVPAGAAVGLVQTVGVSA